MLSLPKSLEPVMLIGMTITTGEAPGTSTGGKQARVIPADSFAIRLKAVRLHAGDITIVQAAERVGVTNQSWGNWERGAVPRDMADVVKLISDEFGIDRDWLMYGGPLSVPERRRRRITSDRTTVR